MATKKASAEKQSNADTQPGNSGGPQLTVTNSNFIGVQYDAKAVDAINSIAEGLIENAQALGENARAFSALAQVLRASNVHIETMLKVGQ